MTSVPDQKPSSILCWIWLTKDVAIIASSLSIEHQDAHPNVAPAKSPDLTKSTSAVFHLCYASCGIWLTFQGVYCSAADNETNTRCLPTCPNHVFSDATFHCPGFYACVHLAPVNSISLREARAASSSCLVFPVS